MENNGVWRKESGLYFLKVLKQKREVQLWEEFQLAMKANHLI